jgi:hypothetical protein
MPSPYGKPYSKPYPTSQPRGETRKGRLPDRMPKQEPEKARYTVLGKKATSYEWNVAQALDAIGMGYDFQVSYWGGRSLAGGMVLDFLLYTAPLPTPVWVNGDIWHRGQRKTVDDYQAAQLDYLFKGQLNPPIAWWGVDSSTPEAAMAAVKRDVG